jgi:hypothetical protein
LYPADWGRKQDFSGRTAGIQKNGRNSGFVCFMEPLPEMAEALAGTGPSGGIDQSRHFP